MFGVPHMAEAPLLVPCARPSEPTLLLTLSSLSAFLPFFALLQRLQMQRSQASMSLLTCRDSVCVVSLFVDDRQLRLTDPEVEAQLRGYMEAVRARFAETYAAKVESLRPTLKAMADGKNQVGA